MKSLSRRKRVEELRGRIERNEHVPLLSTFNLAVFNLIDSCKCVRARDGEKCWKQEGEV